MPRGKRERILALERRAAAARCSVRSRLLSDARGSGEDFSWQRSLPLAPLPNQRGQPAFPLPFGWREPTQHCLCLISLLSSQRAVCCNVMYDVLIPQRCGSPLASKTMSPRKQRVKGLWCVSKLWEGTQKHCRNGHWRSDTSSNNRSRCKYSIHFLQKGCSSQNGVLLFHFYISKKTS